MEKKTKELVVCFIKNFPRKLSRTELVKLIYYFEYTHRCFFRMPYTDIAFVREKNGPFAWDIPTAVSELETDGVVSVESYHTFYGNLAYRHKIVNETLVNELIKDIPLRVTTLANLVICLFANKTFNGFLRLVYETPPMVKILFEEELYGNKLIGRDLNMFAKKNMFRTTKTRLKAAKKRLNLEARGSDEEYIKHLNEVLGEFKILRERADKCLLTRNLRLKNLRRFFAKFIYISHKIHEESVNLHSNYTIFFTAF